LPPWETIYLGAGKKQKVSKADILGFFIKQGGLAVQEIGRIDVLDNASFVAIKREKCIASISILNGIRLKKKMVKIDFAR
jgi:ATP-independent RNA helicase DbpA